MAQELQPFRCEVTPERERVVVAPVGELDMATVGAVELELKALRDAGFKRIVLDLRGLTFMDSTGLHLTVRWAQEAERDGFSFSLRQGPRPVERVFKLSQLADQLPFSDD